MIGPSAGFLVRLLRRPAVARGLHPVPPLKVPRARYPLQLSDQKVGARDPALSSCALRARPSLFPWLLFFLTSPEDHRKSGLQSASSRCRGTREAEASEEAEYPVRQPRLRLKRMG